MGAAPPKGHGRAGRKGSIVPLQVEHIVCLRMPFFPPSAVISMRVYERAVAIIHQGEASWRHFCDAGEAWMVNHVLNIVISRMCGLRIPARSYGGILKEAV